MALVTTDDGGPDQQDSGSWVAGCLHCFFSRVHTFFDVDGPLTMRAADLLGYWVGAPSAMVDAAALIGHHFLLQCAVDFFTATFGTGYVGNDP